MAKRNLLADTLGIAYPIIQAPMLGVTTPEMVAAVSNRGGLGSLAVGGLSSDVTQQLIQKTKRLTGKPFAVNLFVHDVPAYTEEELAPMRKLLLELAARRGYPLNAHDLINFRFYSYRDQIAILVEENIPVVSFTFGCINPENISLLKSKGCTLIGTATCVEEALLLQKHEIDMIAAQGIEAGGHRGTFIDTDRLPQVGLFSLLPQIADTVSVPVIAAGGINDARTMRAAFSLGAAAVQVGTPFIGTWESDAIPSYKETLEKATDTSTVLTKAFSGRWARGISNEMMREIEHSGIPIPPYPIQNILTAKLRKSAQQNNDHAYTNLWAGQSAGGVGPKRTEEVFDFLLNQYQPINE